MNIFNLILFASAYSRKSHISTIHEVSKDNKCEFCGKSFSPVDGLTVHMKYVHDGDQRNYKCEQCLQSFKRKSDLKSHIYVKHEDHKDDYNFFLKWREILIMFRSHHSGDQLES